MFYQLQATIYPVCNYHRYSTDYDDCMRTAPIASHKCCYYVETSFFDASGFEHHRLWPFNSKWNTATLQDDTIPGFHTVGGGAQVEFPPQ